MNILIFNWRDITHHWAGGAELHLHELAKHWVKFGNKVTLLTGGYPGSPREEFIDGVKIIRFGSTYSSFCLLPFYYLIKLNSKKYDFLVDVAHGIPYFVRLLTRKPVFLIVHHDHTRLWETEFNKVVSKLGIFLEQKVTPWVYKNDLVFTFSEGDRARLLGLGHKEVTAIAPGIDAVKYFQNKKVKKAPHPLLLYLGRIRKYKRVDLLIDMFPKIKKEFTKSKLVIVGDGQDKGRVMSMVRKRKLEEDIVFLGYISDVDLKRKWYQKSWLLLFPSMMEGWGFVVFEAALCGTPTVGFKAPGLVDSVKNGQSGYLADSKKDYLKAILRLLKNKKEREILSEGAYNYASKFTWEKMALSYIKKIRENLK